MNAADFIQHKNQIHTPSQYQYKTNSNLPTTSTVYQSQLDQLIHEIDYLKHESSILHQDNAQLQTIIQEFSQKNESIEASHDALLQENRVLLNLLKLGWTEMERIKAIQEQKESVIECLNSIGRHQTEMESSLLASKTRVTKLNEIISNLGKITTDITH